MFTEFVGRVFQDFDEEDHVTDLVFNPDWATYGAVDYGYTNPNVWLLVQVDPFGERMHVLDELYEPNLSPVQFAEEIQRRHLCPTGTLAFFPDPASPGDTAVLKDRLRVGARPHTGGELKHRLDAIREWLRPWPDHDPNKYPRLLFDRKCTNTIRDFLDYRYPDRKDEQDKNAPELPMKKNDHGPEALGRLFAGLIGTQAKHARRARVRSSSMAG